MREERNLSELVTNLCYSFYNPIESDSRFHPDLEIHRLKSFAYEKILDSKIGGKGYSASETELRVSLERAKLKTCLMIALSDNPFTLDGTLQLFDRCMRFFMDANVEDKTRIVRAADFLNGLARIDISSDFEKKLNMEKCFENVATSLRKNKTNENGIDFSPDAFVALLKRKTIRDVPGSHFFTMRDRKARIYRSFASNELRRNKIEECKIKNKFEPEISDDLSAASDIDKSIAVESDKSEFISREKEETAKIKSWPFRGKRQISIKELPERNDYATLRLFSKESAIDHCLNLLLGIESESFFKDERTNAFNTSLPFCRNITAASFDEYSKNFFACAGRMVDLLNYAKIDYKTSRYSVYQAVCEVARQYLKFHKNRITEYRDDNATDRKTEIRSFLRLRWFCKPLIDRLIALSNVMSILNESRNNACFTLNCLHDATLRCAEDRLTRILMMTMFRRACEAYLKPLEEWIFRGEYLPEEDFIIIKNTDCAVVENAKYWSKTYVVKSLSVPQFLQPLQNIISSCGLAANLLRRLSQERRIETDDGISRRLVIYWTLSEREKFVEFCKIYESDEECCVWLRASRALNPNDFLEKRNVRGMCADYKRVRISRLFRGSERNDESSSDFKRIEESSIVKGEDENIAESCMERTGGSSSNLKGSEESVAECAPTEKDGSLAESNLERADESSSGCRVQYDWKDVNELLTKCAEKTNLPKKCAILRRRGVKYEQLDFDLLLSSISSEADIFSRNLERENDGSVECENRDYSDAGYESSALTTSLDTICNSTSLPLRASEATSSNNMEIVSEARANKARNETSGICFEAVKMRQPYDANDLSQVSRNRGKMLSSVLEDKDFIFAPPTSLLRKTELSETNKTRILGSDYQDRLKAEQLLNVDNKNEGNVLESANIESEDGDDRKKTNILPDAENRSKINKMKILGSEYQDRLKLEQSKFENEKRNDENDQLTNIAPNAKNDADSSARVISSKVNDSEESDVDTNADEITRHSAALDPYNSNSLIANSKCNFSNGYDFDQVSVPKKNNVIREKFNLRPSVVEFDNKMRRRTDDKFETNEKYSIVGFAKNDYHLSSNSNDEPDLLLLLQSLTESLNLAINLQYASINRKLTTLLIEKYEYCGYLRAFRDHYFLRDLRFAASFTERLFRSLEKCDEGSPKTVIFNKLEMKEILEDAIDASAKGQSAQLWKKRVSFCADDEFFLEKFPNNTRRLHLRYRVPWPLNIILDDSIFDVYDSIFHLKLIIGRTYWCFAADFHAFKTYRKVTNAGTQFNTVQWYHRRVLQVVKMIGDFVSSDILDGCWNELIADYRERSCDGVECTIDALRDAHTRHLQRVAQRCFVNDERVNERLISIFECAMSFHSILVSRDWKMSDRAPLLYHPRIDRLAKQFGHFQKSLWLFYSALESKCETDSPWKSFLPSLYTHIDAKRL